MGRGRARSRQQQLRLGPGKHEAAARTAGCAEGKPAAVESVVQDAAGQGRLWRGWALAQGWGVGAPGVTLDQGAWLCLFLWLHYLLFPVGSPWEK